MSGQEKTKQMLETSEERRNRCVDELLRDPAVKEALQRDQCSAPKPEQGKRRQVA
jgi:hypothetical protein